MYSPYALHASTASYPAFRPPSAFGLEASRIDFALRKPSFLINDEHDLSSHRRPPASLNEAPAYPISHEATQRLDRLDRNPFLKHSSVVLRPKYGGGGGEGTLG